MSEMPRPRQQRFVAFDFDGTLADSFPLFLQAYGTIARRHGFAVFTPEELQTMRGLSSRDFMARAGLPAWKLPAVMNDFRRFMAAHAGKVSVFEGVPGTLRALAADGVRLAVVTSNTGATVRAVLGDGLIACFAHVDCGISLFGKAARLRRLARREGSLAPVYVGDELRDADAAREAGYAFGAVAWGYTDPAALQRAAPEHLFRQPAELLKLR